MISKNDRKQNGAARVAAVAIGMGLLLHGATAGAHNNTGQCTVAFDNHFALTNTYINARYTFAFSTAFNSAGKLDTCANAQFPGVCWTYRHRCATNYVNVEDISGIGHFHLLFTDPAFDPVCFVDPGDGYGAGNGKMVGTSCLLPDWTREPRKTSHHFGNSWLSIKMHPPGSMATQTVFDLARIHIGGTVPIQLWFHSTIDGGWYGWSSMAPNNWNTLASSHDIDEVQISNASGDPHDSYEIDDFDILD